MYRHLTGWASMSPKWAIPIKISSISSSNSSQKTHKRCWAEPHLCIPNSSRSQTLSTLSLHKSVSLITPFLILGCEATDSGWSWWLITGTPTPWVPLYQEPRKALPVKEHASHPGLWSQHLGGRRRRAEVERFPELQSKLDASMGICETLSERNKNLQPKMIKQRACINSLL